MEVDSYIKNNRLTLLVKPNASKTEIISFDETKQRLRVAIAAPAEKNKANIEVIRFFSKLLKKKVRLISGKTSKEKTIQISS